MNEILRGQVYWVNLNPTQGAEIKKIRPCVVISIDPVNKARHTVVVIPISSSAQVRLPMTIPVMCGDQKSAVVIDQIRTVDKSRLQDKVCELSSKEMLAVERALQIVLGLSKL